MGLGFSVACMLKCLQDKVQQFLLFLILNVKVTAISQILIDVKTEREILQAFWQTQYSSKILFVP